MELSRGCRELFERCFCVTSLWFTQRYSLVYPFLGENSDAVKPRKASKPTASAVSIASKGQQPREQASSPKLSPPKLMKRPEKTLGNGLHLIGRGRCQQSGRRRWKSSNSATSSEKKTGTEKRLITAAALKLQRQQPLLPPPPKRGTPTYFLAKSLPPVTANLKAMLAWFGPLGADKTLVFWKSHSRRVQCTYEPDSMKEF